MTSMPAIRSPEDLLAWCRGVDRASAEQFAEFAGTFAMANNRDAARELQALASWKERHADDGCAPISPDWYIVDPGDPTALHHLMQPWHVVRIALDNEDRIRGHLHALASRPAPPDLRDMVRALLDHLQTRIHHLERRLAGLPAPEPGWDDDPDPPFFDE